MKKIKFLRHAQSAGNAGLRTADPAEISLTEAGRLAAEAAAKNYEGSPPDLIVVSPFRRAQETAAPFITRFAPASLESWPLQEFTYLSPRRVGASTTQERLPMVEAYWKTATPETNDGEGAESFGEFIARVQTALEKLRNRSEQSILIVCHEMVINAAKWLETRKPDFCAVHAPQQFREFFLASPIPNLGTWDYPALLGAEHDAKHEAKQTESRAVMAELLRQRDAETDPAKREILQDDAYSLAMAGLDLGDDGRELVAEINPQKQNKT